MRRSYKNEEFDWLFDFVTVTGKNNRNFNRRKITSGYHLVAKTIWSCIAKWVDEAGLSQFWGISKRWAESLLWW